MRIVVDVCLPEEWVETLLEAGFDSIHWSSVGDRSASDQHVLEWTRENGCVLFSHDLDFGAILAATEARAPSVIQLREQNVDPDSVGEAAVRAIRAHESAIEEGALVSFDLVRSRVRLLPLR